MSFKHFFCFEIYFTKNFVYKGLVIQKVILRYGNTEFSKSCHKIRKIEQAHHVVHCAKKLFFKSSNSMHAQQHKMVAFNSMIHRLLSIPLNPERFNWERNYIIEVAKKNGYSQSTIEKIFYKKAMRAENRRLLALFV